MLSSLVVVVVPVRGVVAVVVLVGIAQELSRVLVLALTR